MLDFNLPCTTERLCPFAGRVQEAGCCYSSIPVYWHFLAASFSSKAMAPMATILWQQLFGDAKIESYDKDRPGAFYVSKLVSHQIGLILSGILDHMEYHGPTDLLAAAAEDLYIPARLKDRVFGGHLVIR